MKAGLTWPINHRMLKRQVTKLDGKMAEKEARTLGVRPNAHHPGRPLLKRVGDCICQ